MRQEALNDAPSLTEATALLRQMAEHHQHAADRASQDKTAWPIASVSVAPLRSMMSQSREHTVARAATPHGSECRNWPIWTKRLGSL